MRLLKTIANSILALAISTAATLRAAPPAAPAPAEAASEKLGAVRSIQTNGRETLIKCDKGTVRVNFWSDDVVRLQMSEDGSFSNFDDSKAFMIEPGLAAFKGVVPKATEVANGVRLSTDRLVLEITKSPFGFRFFAPDGKTLLTEGTFETGVRAVFKQDAGGTEEHFFGLQNEHDDTLDQRGRKVWLNDNNGAGWPSPFVMSTAGYGLFFNNEESVGTYFTLQQPMVIENIESKGPMDLFFIAGGDFKQLLKTYTDITGRAEMPPKKLLGFQYLVQGTPIFHEESFGDWIKNGYPIDSCITFTDQKVEEPWEIEQVAGTAERVHKQHGLFGFYYDLPGWPGTFRKTKPEPIKPPYEGWDQFKDVVKTRLLDNGVDWFWIDETDGPWAPRLQHNLYTALKEAQEAHGNTRSFNCARGGYAGSQRFGYPWMGDVPYDRKMVISNLANGLSGFPHSTHDMSGASLNKGMSDDAFLNGVKTAMLNPFPQANAWLKWNPKSHRPWDWSQDVQDVFRKFVALHYQLIPYFYTLSWEAHQNGLPVWRALALENPGDRETYFADEVLIGDSLLMAPLYKEQVRPVYLPEGTWYYLFDSAMHFSGPTRLSGVQPPQDQYPIFIKGGAIIPMAPTMKYVDEKPVDPLTFLIYPLDAGTSSFTLYEDDGVTRDYAKGAYCTTRIDCEGSTSQVKITVDERTGNYKPAPRARVLSVFQSAKPTRVELDGKALQEIETREKFDAAAEGWGYFPDTLTGVTRVFVKSLDDGKKSQVLIARAAAGAATDKPKLTPVFDNEQARSFDKYKDVPSKASFVKEDRSTSGSWKGVYGSQGYVSPGLGKKLPPNTDVQITGQGVIWEKSSTETRALQKETAEDRTIAGWQGRDVVIEVLTTDTKPRKITLFLIDVDGYKDPKRVRTSNVSAFNPITNEPYDARKVEAYHDGVYLTYEVSGSVTFQLFRIKGPTAIVGGIFFDE